MEFRLLCFVFVVVAGLRAEPAAVEANLNSLLQNSPFGQRAPEGTGPAQPTALELRGVIFDGGEVLFSVYDTASKSSRWVAINEAGNPFTVRSYDSAKNEVKVNFQGRDLTLGLKQATVIALAAPPMPSAPPVPAPGTGPVVSPGPPAGAPSDEAVRLAQIAQEISRRRALRQQAKQQSNSPNPPQPPGAGRP